MDRNVFVGRERELADLERRLVDSRTVGGAVVLCEGDAGMGKTALAAELARRARGQGSSVAWGACLEGEGTTAYRPWVQVVSALGRAVGDLIIPAADDNASRFRLFADVVEVLRGAGAERGLLVVLDDLHWADMASLRLLQVVASEAASCRLLVLGLYRGADAYPRAEVAALLPAILRERTASLLTLRGLHRIDVEQLVAALPERPTEDVVQTVHERAEGNPLFVLELLRLIAKVGATRSLPVGVREVIGRRLDRIPAETRELLQQAAVVGRDFPIGVLAAVAGQPVTEVADTLALAMADELVIEGDGQRLRFAHALIQEVAYAELAVAQRQLLHRRAAQALQGFNGAGETLDALAHHLRQAAALGNADIALTVTLQAAQRARGQLAYEHAAFQYRQALQLLPLVADAAGDRTQLLLELARCEFRSGAVDAAWQSCRAAADLGRAAGDALMVADAAVVLRDMANSPIQDELHALCREALTMLRGADPVREARLLGQLSITAAGFNEPEPGLSQRAELCAEASGDLDARFLALQARAYELVDMQYTLQRLAVGERTVHLGRESGRDDYLVWGHAWRIDAFWQLGRRVQMDAEVAALAAVVTHLKEPLWLWRLKMTRASIALMEGRHDTARELAEDALLLGRRGGHQAADFLDLVFNTHLSIQTSDGQQPVLERVRAFAEQGPILSKGWLMWVLANMGRMEEAAALWQSVVVPHIAAFPRHVPEWIIGRSGFADMCVLLGDTAVARKIYADLLPFADKQVAAGSFTPTGGPVALYLGKLALLREDHDTAEVHLTSALHSAAAMGSAPYQAYTRLELARLLLSRRGRADMRDAHAHLHAALDTARTLGMKPLAAQVQALAAQHRLDREGPLSSREEQVAGLVADGLSNRQIAHRLHLSERTVENHVANILGKLGFDSRAKVAAWHAGRGVER
jgi:DNA-binding CsgD family transcriptional regulator